MTERQRLHTAKHMLNDLLFLAKGGYSKMNEPIGSRLNGPLVGHRKEHMEVRDAIGE